MNAIRSVHQISSSGTNDVVTRYLSCYCEFCIIRQYSKCNEKDKVGNIKHAEMKEEEIKESNEDDIYEDDLIPIYELVNVGDIIAVVAVDEDYYLLEVTQKCRTLKSDSTDDYNTSYNKGTKVVEGRYFGRSGKSLLQYRLLQRHKALVPALSVVYICTEITPGKVSGYQK